MHKSCLFGKYEYRENFFEKIVFRKKNSYFCTRKAKLRRKDAGVVDRDGLENRCTGNCTEGSNPSLSAEFISRKI